MSPIQLVHQYMEIVFDGSKIEDLEPLLAADFAFSGPFYSCSSAKEYIAEMQANPPKGFSYHLLHSFENDGSICLIYEFAKPGISTTMAQVFEISGQQISASRLIFDAKAFPTKGG